MTKTELAFVTVVPVSFQSVFLLSIMIGVLMTLLLASLPVEMSISRFIIEDMFYYLTTARNIISGNGVSLDGVHPTNGFHPLWMIICTGITSIFGDHPNQVVHVSLLLCAFFFFGTGFVLYQTLRRTSGKIVALPTAALFLCNYRTITIALGGLETALYGFMIMLVLHFLISRKYINEYRSAVVLGVLLGLTYLSRMDAFLLGAVVLGGLVFRGALKEFPQRVGRVFVAGSISLVFVIPWFVFSLNNSGTFLPNSSRAITSWKTPPWNSTDSVTARFFAFIRDRIGNAIEPANDLANQFGFWPIASHPFGITRYFGAVALLSAVVFIFIIIWRVHKSRELLPHWWMPVFIVVHTGYYAFFHSPRIRYLYPVSLVLLVFVPMCIGVLLRDSSSKRLCIRIVCSIFLFLIINNTISGIQAYHNGYATVRSHSLHQGLYAELAPWIADNTESDAIIGSFNAGIISYYSYRQTVNLDGVMNDSAIMAIQSKQLDHYINAQGILYLADVHREIEKFMNGFGGNPNWRTEWTIVHEVVCTYAGGLKSTSLVVMRKE